MLYKVQCLQNHNLCWRGSKLNVWEESCFEAPFFAPFIAGKYYTGSVLAFHGTTYSISGQK